MSFERIYVPAIEERDALNAAANPDTTRELMSSYYADLLRCARIHGVRSIDWRKVNRAILNRWSVSGLNYIKKLAWKRAA